MKTDTTGGTRERILEVALALFAKRGYSAVSIRDICAEVGIRESTVYYHFKNKRAIFETLQSCFSERVDSLFGRLTTAITDPSRLDEAFFRRVGEVYMEQFLLDGFCNGFLRALYMEQFGSEAARALYEKYVFVLPLRFQSGVFATLMRMGILPPGDSDYLAVTYYAPVFLYMQRDLFSGALTEEKIARFRRDTGRHIAAFVGEGAEEHD